MIADNLDEIFHAIDRLNRDQLAQLRAYVEQRITQPQLQIAAESPKEKADALMRAFAEMREGLTKEELDEMIEAMNSEYIEPLDAHDYAWLDDANDAEEERD